MKILAATGMDFSLVLEPEAILRLPDGTVSREIVQYVAQTGGEPRVKLIAGRDGGYFAPIEGKIAVHHVSYWVDDLLPAVCQLEAAGFEVEATGLETDGVTARYAYMVAPGVVRVELGLVANRAQFDDWAG